MTRLPSLLAASALAACAALPAAAHSIPVPIVNIEVFDRTDGTTLAVYDKDGRRYIVGTPGHEYAVRIRNITPRRVLAVTSVDGVNVVSGETASPGQSGYVIEPWGSVEIAGWRKSLSHTAAFYFTDLSDSYAARTGRPVDVGVIGVAAFTERAPRIAYRQRIAPWSEEEGRAQSGPRSEPLTKDEALPSAAPAAPSESAANAQSGARDDFAARKQSAESLAGGVARAPVPAPKLGTGHGREESSPVQQVRFERESDTPNQTVIVQYDRRENLVAMGVIPAPAVAYRAPNPNPFPAMRFVPDPPR